MILYIENPKESKKKKKIELINETANLQGMILIQRNPFHSETLTMRKHREKLRKQFHFPLRQKE